MATGPQHYREAERLRTEAGEWMDADFGWKASLSTEERLAYRATDLADAQVHATLALAAATALATTGVGEADMGEWTALICEPDDPDEADTEAYVEREYEAHEASQAWLGAHPDEFVDEDAETMNGYTAEQLNGNACSVCGGSFKPGEASEPSGYVLDHGQLSAHTACLDESEA